MEIIACHCNDLPPHDHLGGKGEVIDGVWTVPYDPERFRIWVDWKALAEGLGRSLARIETVVLQIRACDDCLHAGEHFPTPFCTLHALRLGIALSDSRHVT